MLYFNRIDIFEVIDVNKTSESKECNTCHNWYFLDKGFKFQPYVCNRCHDLMLSMNFSYTATLIIKVAHYHCPSKISKNEAINLM